MGLLIGLGCLKLVAELPPAASPQPQTANTPGSTFQRVKVFDDRVFELSIDKPVTNTTKSGATGAERFLADEEDLNSGSRKEWIENCSGAPDSKTYRDCYSKQKQEGIRKLREKFNNRSDGLRSPWQGDDKRGKGIPKE